MPIMARGFFETNPRGTMHVCARCHISRRQDASTQMLGEWICNGCDDVFKRDWYVSDANMMTKTPEEINELQVAFLEGEPHPPTKAVKINWQEIADA